jgi:hypothetical protein
VAALTPPENAAAPITVKPPVNTSRLCMVSP